MSASTQNQAFSALLFLYRDVLGRQLTGLRETLRAKPSVRVPLVLARDQVSAILRHLHGVEGLMASVMYGAGLRLLGSCHLRGKDLDFTKREITVRDGKGRKDRITVLPSALALHRSGFSPYTGQVTKVFDGYFEMGDAALHAV